MEKANLYHEYQEKEQNKKIQAIQTSISVIIIIAIVVTFITYVYYNLQNPSTSVEYWNNPSSTEDLSEYNCYCNSTVVSLSFLQAKNTQCSLNVPNCDCLGLIQRAAGLIVHWPLSTSLMQSIPQLYNFLNQGFIQYDLSINAGTCAQCAYCLSSYVDIDYPKYKKLCDPINCERTVLETPPQIFYNGLSFAGGLWSFYYFAGTVVITIASLLLMNNKRPSSPSSPSSPEEGVNLTVNST